MKLKKIGLLISLIVSTQVFAQKPNIVIILADDLGYSDLSSFGSEIKTPHIDSLAYQGTRFTNYHTPATCSPTRAELMSGTDHHLAGLGAMAETMREDAARFDFEPRPQFLGKPGYEGYLNERSLTLPQVLKDNGYKTLMAGKWHLGYTPETNPAHKGFDYSYALLNGADSHFKSLPEGIQRKTIYTENGQKVEIPDDFYSTDFFTQKIIEYIGQDKNPSQPFFAYVALTAPHWPLQVPVSYLNMYKGQYDIGYDAIKQKRLERMLELRIINSTNTAKVLSKEKTPLGLDTWDKLTSEQRKVEARKMELYAAQVKNMDDNVGKLINHLKKIKQYDNTLFIFMSDNGAEGFYRPSPGYDNSYDNLGKTKSYELIGPRWSEVSSAPFSLWKGTAAEGGVSAPAIVKLPKHSQARISSQFVNVKDIFPTVLELTQSSMNAEQQDPTKFNQPSGKSWISYLKGKTNSIYGKNFIYADELHGDAYVRNHKWKLTRTLTKNLNGPDWKLYDLENDRSETTDLSQKYPEIVKQLHQEYIKYTQRVGVLNFSE